MIFEFLSSGTTILYCPHCKGMLYNPCTNEILRGAVLLYERLAGRFAVDTILLYLSRKENIRLALSST